MTVSILLIKSLELDIIVNKLILKIHSNVILIRVFCWARIPGENFGAVNLICKGRDEDKKVQVHPCFIA